MNIITKQDTTGVKNDLLVGELGLDNTGNDDGRIYVGSLSGNKAIALRSDILNASQCTRSCDSVDVGSLMSECIGEMVYLIDMDRFIYSKEVNSSEWFNLIDNSIFTRPDHGIGSPGVFTSSFETVESASGGWIFNDGETISTSPSGGQWCIRSNTPSSGTGASSAKDGSKFVFTEVSSGGHSTDFTMETNNFSKCTDIKFWYDLHGTNCGTVSIEVFDGTNWNTIWEGSESTSSIWREVTIDLSVFMVNKLRFRYNGASGWSGDLCIDMIEITSVE